MSRQSWLNNILGRKVTAMQEEHLSQPPSREGSARDMLHHDLLTRTSGRSPGNGRPSYLIDVSDAAAIKHALVSTLVHSGGRDPGNARPKDWYYALAFLVRGIMSERRLATIRRQTQTKARRVYYLSMEYLLGRSLIKTLIDLEMLEDARKALAELGQDVEAVASIEQDPGLGNGGLGRLAACFLDSMASLQIDGSGYGLRYDFGTFSQRIEDGRQVETPDSWLKDGSPWLFARPDVCFDVHFNGRVECCGGDTKGVRPAAWCDTNRVIATAYDLPISGYRNGEVTMLRLWTARATEDIDLSRFNRGDYVASVSHKIITKTLSRVLYPDDSTHEGRELRLKQEYFFVSASLQDIVSKHLALGEPLDTFADKVIIQLNDTHPALGVAELMRLLVDVHGFDWDKAWSITSRAFAYTNHALMSEALERWPVAMLRNLLPRHVDSIFLINERFLAEVREKEPGNPGATYATSLVEDRDYSVRMAHLAIIGSERVNGVAKLHTDLLKANVFPQFVKLYPQKFVNITNGVTQRRWLLQANPALSELITDKIGDDWTVDLSDIGRLRPLADDVAFRARFREAKAAGKKRLADLIEEKTGVAVPADAMIDAQVKRIHEYKRQLLNLLHVITLYNRIRDGKAPANSRVVLMAGKAAPAYYMAKLIVRLVHDVGKVINSAPKVGDKLKLVFLPDYSVSLAETIFPGADLSEQISTAGTEASGTGNMKFALNGAHTIGTWDGANIEIAQAVGLDNITIFGLRAEEVAARKARGYHSREHYQKEPELARALDMIGRGAFSPGDTSRYGAIVHSLLDAGDHYMLLADYASYCAAQRTVEAKYADQDHWSRTAILNVAGMGYFSSDRAIKEYAELIWHVKPGG